MKMIDERERYERAFERFPMPEPSWDRLIRRRDRKRRNQRVAAGIVGVAVFVAAIWVVTTGGPFDRTQMPGASGAVATAPTGPTADATEPPHPIGVGLLGLPPEGATPSTPEHGKLVLFFGFGHTSGDAGRFTMNLYTDGRVIWQRLGGSFGDHASSTGLIEQRLTPEGVDLVLAEVLSTGLVDRDREFIDAPGDLHYGGIEVHAGDQVVHLAWGDAGFDAGTDPIATTPTQDQVDTLERLDARLEYLTSWLPATAWEDPEFRTYVPSRYSVCYFVQGDRLGQASLLQKLPAPAANLLGSLDATRSEAENLLGPFSVWCSVVTTEEARNLVGILQDARATTHSPESAYAFPPGLPDGQAVDIQISPSLPHEVA